MQECDLHYQHTDLHSSEQSIITTTTKSFLEPRIYDLAVKNEGFLNILEDKHSTIKKMTLFKTSVLILIKEND
jgi:hypothetical protein